MSSGSSDEEDLDPAAAERRARALMLLAKVKREREAKAPESSKGSSGEEEAQFLRTLQASASRDEMLRSIRDRLSVLDVNLGATPVAATPLRASQAPKTAGEKDAAVAARAKAAADEAAAEASAAKAEAALRAALTRLCDGDLAGLATHAIDPEFWRREAMVQPKARASPTGDGCAIGAKWSGAACAVAAAVAAAGLAAALGVKRPAATSVTTTAAAAVAAAAVGLRMPRGGHTSELRVPEAELRAMGASLDANGFGVAQPERWGWGEDEERLEGLRQVGQTLHIPLRASKGCGTWDSCCIHVTRVRLLAFVRAHSSHALHTPHDARAGGARAGTPRLAARVRVHAGRGMGGGRQAVGSHARLAGR